MTNSTSQPTSPDQDKSTGSFDVPPALASLGYLRVTAWVNPNDMDDLLSLADEDKLPVSECAGMLIGACLSSLSVNDPPHKEDASWRSRVEFLPGAVYVLSNPSMPSIVKIGHTTADPHLRAKDLSAGSGVPTPFALEGFIKCLSCKSTEFRVHQHFDRFRVNQNREFFRVDPIDALETIAGFARRLDQVVSGNKRTRG